MRDLSSRGTQGVGRIGRVARCAALLAACLCAGLLLPRAAAAATPSPAWRLSVSSQPTELVPGSTARQGFLVVATNVGAADTGGVVTLTDRVPAGTRPAEPPEGCETLGRRITCVIEEVLHPGESLMRFLPVTVTVATGVGLENVAKIVGGGGEGAERTVEVGVGGAPPAFGFLSGRSGLEGALTGPDGAPVTRAGSTPYELVVGLGFPTEAVGSEVSNVAHPRDVAVDLPPGLSLDPTAVTRCRQAQLQRGECPPASQVGLVTVTTELLSLAFEDVPLYNVVPPPGSASAFGFDVAGVLAVDLLGSVRSGDYGLSAQASDLLARYPVLSMQMQFWGDPSDPSHDAVRGAAVEPSARPLIALPSDCGPLELAVRADSWEEPGSFASRSAAIGSLAGGPIEVEGCSALSFEPAISIQPTTAAADSAGGVRVSVDVPQRSGPEGSTTSSLRRAVVALPAGMAVNPSAVGGRAACTPAQVGLVSQVGQTQARFDGEPAACPDASKLGTVEATTPLLQDEAGGTSTPHPLTGSIYLAQPRQNPFGSLFALYAVVEDPETGIVIKLAGNVTIDPVSGQVTASFEELPQLPIEELKLDFFEGPRAVLRTPAVCGSYSSHAGLTPWSGTAPVQEDSAFSIAAGPSGGACASAPGQLSAAPRFDAGSVSPAAGRYTPFVLDLSRGDGSQELRSFEVSLPDGLVGRLAGSAECSNAALAAAAAKSGGEEEASPSCPAASRLGRVVARVGAGSSPYPAEGEVYLAGPYRGAPLSIAVVTPALAGPFDLGTVVVRAAVFVNPTTGRLTVRSDALPQILDGVPLDIRSLQIELDKPDLIRNPTSCEPATITGSATTTLGQVSPLSIRFQMSGCGALAFRPKLSMRLRGAHGRNGHPALRAVLRGDPEGAALKSARFSLPGGELLDLKHVRALCPRQAAAGACPKGSRLGHLRLYSPSLESPLEGPVYLRVPSHRLPDLIAEVRSGELRFLLHGRTTDAGGRIGVALQALPDIPLSRAILSLAGGRRGILVNSRSLCRKRGYARASLGAHNGRRRHLRVRPQVAGCSRKR